MAEQPTQGTLQYMNWPAPDPSQLRRASTNLDAFAVGALAKRAGGDAWRTAKRVWLLISLPWLAVAAAVLVAVRQIRDHSAVEALEAALETFTATSAQPDTAIETLIDTVSAIDYTGLVTLVVTWLAGLGMFYIATVAYTTTMVCLETESVRRGEERAPRTTTIIRAVTRIPAMTLAYLYCYLLPWLLTAAAVTGTLLVSGHAAMSVLVGALGLVFTIYWTVKNSLVGVTVATQRGFVTPVGAAARAVKGHWWAVLGRLLLLTLAVGMVGTALGSLAQIGALLGTSGLVALWVTFRILSTLVGTTVTAATQLAMLDALTETTGEQPN